jgi:hypothetical protein
MRVPRISRKLTIPLVFVIIVGVVVVGIGVSGGYHKSKLNRVQQQLEKVLQEGKRSIQEPEGVGVPKPGISLPPIPHYPMVPTEPLNDSVDALDFVSPTVGWDTVGSWYNTSHFLPSPLYETTDGGILWKEVIDSVDVGDYLDFVNPMDGWDVGATPGILRTTDGGQHWTVLAQPDGKQGSRSLGNITQVVSFSSPESGWALVSSGVMYSTNNGGSTWTRIPNVPRLPEQLCMASPTSGYVMNTKGIYVTSNSGSSWALSYPTPPQVNLATIYGEPILACDGPTAEVMYPLNNGRHNPSDAPVSRNSPVVARTANFGKSWKIVYVAGGAPIMSNIGPQLAGMRGSVATRFLVPLGTEGFALFADERLPFNGDVTAYTRSEMVATYNGGASFIDPGITSGQGTETVSASAVSPNQIFVAESVGVYPSTTFLFETTNGGATWHVVDSAPSSKWPPLQ